MRHGHLLLRVYRIRGADALHPDVNRAKSIFACRVQVFGGLEQVGFFQEALEGKVVLQIQGVGCLFLFALSGRSLVFRL